MQVNRQTDRLTRLSTELVRRLQLLERQELAACCGVPLSRSVVLRVLARRGDRRMSELAEELGVAQSTATRLVEPLVAEGLVERRRARDDRRAVEVALTAEGARRAQTVQAGSRRCCSPTTRSSSPAFTPARPFANRPSSIRSARPSCRSPTCWWRSAPTRWSGSTPTTPIACRGIACW